MTVYIAGKMRGVPYYNFPAFDFAARKFRDEGHVVFNPADMDREHGFDAMLLPSDSDWNAIPDHFDLSCCVDRDIEAVKKSDAIFMLVGWETSTGARAEKALAEWLGQKIIYQEGYISSSEAVPTLDCSQKSTNPKQMSGSAKLPLHLWPETATIMGCVAMLDGALKYGRSNYREAGVQATIYIDACKRHLNYWLEGEECAQDNGVPHLAHAIACLAILIDSQAAGRLNDDRMLAGGYVKLVEQLTPHVNRLKELHKERNPKHWSIADNKEVKT